MSQAESLHMLTLTSILFDIVCMGILRSMDHDKNPDIQGYRRQQPSRDTGPSKDARAERHAHAADLISTMWLFRAYYTLPRSALNVHGCVAAAFGTVFDLEAGGSQTEVFMKACQGLQELGSTFESANAALLALKALITKHHLSVPQRAWSYFKTSTAATADDALKRLRVPAVIPVDRLDEDATSGSASDGYYLSIAELINKLSTTELHEYDGKDDEQNGES